MTSGVEVVTVQGAWNGWRTAEVRLHNLSGVHWRQPEHAPRQLVHGYVSCGDVLSGDIPHDCAATAGPHHLLVCMLKAHNTAEVFADLVNRASEAAPSPDPAGAGRGHSHAARV